MRRFVSLACALAALSAGGVLAAAPAAGRTVRVHTKLTWKPHGSAPEYASDIRLSITRNGVDALRRARVVHGSRWIVPREPHRPVPVHVVDLTGSGEPDVLVDLSTGGAHCCNEARVYHWAGHRYARSPLYDFGPTGYRLRRLAHDGSVELVAKLETDSELDIAYSDSGFPIEVWRLRGGRLRNVSRRFPALLRRDARTWRTRQLRQHAAGDVSVGSLAAYVVDLERTGQAAAVDAAIAAAAADGELSPFTPASFRAATAALLRALDAKHPPTSFDG
jgi:hypothetical protein